MLKLILLSLFSFSSFSISAASGRLYFNKFLGHVHKTMSDEAPSMTTIQCAHSLEVIEYKNLLSGWVYVKAGEDKGFIREEFLSDKRPDCFQERYPKFYSNSNLDITQMYYWGRLYDRFQSGSSQIK